MVGAKQGWREAPYVACPAGLPEIAGGDAAPLTTAFGVVRIAPGARATDAHGAPDVMRGEETQILGALAAGGGDGVYVLPGTHSKWARVEGGRIARLRDLHDRRGVRRAEGSQRARPHDGAGAATGEGFARGVEAARGLERPGDLLHAIFAARTFGLFETLPPDQLGEYLSGLLIGAEILAGARGARARSRSARRR